MFGFGVFYVSLIITHAYCFTSLSALESEYLVEALSLPLYPSLLSKVHAARLTGAVLEIDAVSVRVVRKLKQRFYLASQHILQSNGVVSGVPSV
jgi:hypothetical protein